MKWMIPQPMQPFSLEYGDRCLLPGTSFVIQAFPCCVKLSPLSAPLCPVAEVALEGTGYVQKFMIQQNIRKQAVAVRSTFDQGLLALKIFQEQGAIWLEVTRSTLLSASLSWQNEKIPLEKGNRLKLHEASLHKEPRELETLFLGVTKKQDWRAMLRRQSLAEVLPALFQIGQMYEAQEKGQEQWLVLQQLDRALQSGDHGQIEPALKQLTFQPFLPFMIPSKYDLEYRGAFRGVETEAAQEEDLLAWGARCIRKLFIQQNREGVLLLPHLLSAFPSGYLSNVKTPDFLCDLVWAKRKPLRIRIRAMKKGQATLHFPKGIKSCRLRKGREQKGMDFFSGQSVSFSPSEVFLLDRFQK